MAQPGGGQVADATPTAAEVNFTFGKANSEPSHHWSLLYVVFSAYPLGLGPSKNHGELLAHNQRVGIPPFGMI